MKVWRYGQPDPLPNGLLQLDTYLERLRLETGWLVLFDQRQHTELPGPGLGLQSLQSPAGRAITLVKV
jgi:hypothetical protein